MMHRAIISRVNYIKTYHCIESVAYFNEELLACWQAPRAEVVLVVSRSRVPQDGHHEGLQLDDCSVTMHIPRPLRPPRIPEQPSETLTSALVATEGTALCCVPRPKGLMMDCDGG
jgi:hypothetical protein